MRAMSYKRPSRSTSDEVPTNSYVREALAKQAASRPPKTPAKLMPVTPTLPKVYKPKGRRRRTV
jgi:hypothetical protein